MCPEIPRTNLIDISLASSIVESYGFAGFAVVPEVSQGGIRPENAVWINGV